MYEETEMLITLIGSLHRDQKLILYPRNTYVYYTPIKSKKVSAVYEVRGNAVQQTPQLEGWNCTHQALSNTTCG